MKKRVGELLRTPIVMGDDNEINKYEIKYTVDNEGTVDLFKRDDNGEVVSITGGKAPTDTKVLKFHQSELPPNEIVDMFKNQYQDRINSSIDIDNSFLQFLGSIGVKSFYRENTVNTWKTYDTNNQTWVNLPEDYKCDDYAYIEFYKSTEWTYSQSIKAVIPILAQSTKLIIVIDSNWTEAGGNDHSKTIELY